MTIKKRLYQEVASALIQEIESGKYTIGDKLPAERLIIERMNVSRTVVREAIIMLEVEGYVEVRKGSGIHVVANRRQENEAHSLSDKLDDTGPFELLQARQLLESNIAEFAATQVNRSDIQYLLEVQEHARNEDRWRDSQWDLKFHVGVATATQNMALAVMVEQMWMQRLRNPYWLKLHEHIDDKSIDSWCNEHDQILKALIQKNPTAAKRAMWQHLENTKQMLFKAADQDFDPLDDRYLFSENPVVHLLD